jgi:fucose permease
MTKARTVPVSLVALAFIAFIALGMPDGLLGVAWPTMRLAFGQPLDSLGLLLIGATSGYLCSAFVVGALLRRFGVGRLLAYSSLLTAAALAGYTVCPWWPLMVPLAAMAGLGAGAIDAGLNAYVEANFGERLMQWLHACFGVGITAGPLIMTAGLAASGSFRPGYLVVAAFQAALGLFFLARAGLWERHTAAPHPDKAAAASPFKDTLANPRSWLSALLFYIYAGIELGLGHWAYTFLTVRLGVAPAAAGFWTGGYWASFTVGRILAGLFARRLPARTLAWIGMGGAAAAAATLAVSPWAPLSLAAIVLMGFAIAPIFPALVSGTGDRVGRRHTASTIGMQMSFAGLGVGTLPGAIGFLAERFGLGVVPVAVALFAVLLLLLNGYFAATRPKA